MARKQPEQDPAAAGEAPTCGVSQRVQAARGRGRPKKERPDQSNVTPALKAEAIEQYLQDRGAIARLTAKCGSNLARFEAQGVDPKYVKAAAAMAKYSRDEAAAHLSAQAEYAVAAGIVSVDDLDWSQDQGAFAFKPASGDLADRLKETRARDQGYKAGRSGHSKESNPYKSRPGSPEFVGWLDGLQNGLEDRRDRKADADRTGQAHDSRQRRDPSAAHEHTAEQVAQGVADELAGAQV